MSITGATIEQLLVDVPPASTVSASVIEDFRHTHKSKRLIVLDDDPTGTQSVRDLPVLTAWEVEDLLWAFDTGAHAIYILTNSRSLDEDAARRVNEQVSANALIAAKQRGINLAFVSRSDSTLRGHFPLETDVLGDVLAADGNIVDGVIVVPAFPDAGRITVNSTHYAYLDGHGYVPVGETEFAKDATFGFVSSSLPDWVEEKTRASVMASDVSAFRLGDLLGDGERLYKALLELSHGQIVVVDAVADSDLRALSKALLRAEEDGKNFIYRVGPPFVRAMVGQEPSGPVDLASLSTGASEQRGEFGLIAIGSHVSLTTAQLSHLCEALDPTVVEIDVERVLKHETEPYVQELAEIAQHALQKNHVVIQTSRTLIKGDSPDASLAIARDVSDFLVKLVNRVVTDVTPRFVIAKGGITSSDVASRALEISRAVVLGPLLDGIVSLWEPITGVIPKVPYIVFAGNVGSAASLTEAVKRLS